MKTIEKLIELNKLSVALNYPISKLSITDAVSILKDVENVFKKHFEKSDFPHPINTLHGDMKADAS